MDGDGLNAYVWAGPNGRIDGWSNSSDSESHVTLSIGGTLRRSIL